jgi:hypothetical protein
MKELYSVSVVVVLVDKLVVIVPNAGCKIVGVAMIIIIKRAGVIGKPLLLIIQDRCITLHSSRHHFLPVTITLPTPVLAKTSFHHSNSCA